MTSFAPFEGESVITFFAVAYLIMGIASLITGKYWLGRGQVLLGHEARVSGFLVAMPIPLANGGAFIAAIVLELSGKPAAAHEEFLGFVGTWSLILALVTFGVWGQVRARRRFTEQQAAATTGTDAEPAAD